MSDLKRYQIILPGWMIDYLKKEAKINGVSFSAQIRFKICETILGVKNVKAAHKYEEDILFSARKAVEG